MVSKTDSTIKKPYLRPERRYKWRVEKECAVCKKIFLPSQEKSKYCSNDCHNRKYKEWVNKDPIRYKAHGLASKVKGITRDDAEALLRDILEKPCKYCGEIITLDNASLDHKIPRYYRRKKSEEEIRELNKLDNLQIICRKCNFYKLDLTDEEYTKLKVFLKDNPEVEKKLYKRIWISPF